MDPNVKLSTAQSLSTSAQYNVKYPIPQSCWCAHVHDIRHMPRCFICCDYSVKVLIEPWYGSLGCSKVNLPLFAWLEGPLVDVWW